MANNRAVPVGWGHSEEAGVRLSLDMALVIWNAACDAGHDPEELVTKFKELGDGQLAVGLFRNEDDDFNAPLEGLGFIVEMGFWSSLDGRMPPNWPGAKPPPGYGLPGEGVPVEDPLAWTREP